MRNFYVRVACAVLAMAVRDARGKRRGNRNNAQVWIREVGLEWFDLLGMNPEVINDAIQEVK